ncbi:ABC transporter ATP-binding protein [Anaerolineales bacterium HSG24]|nr:ABC transporter ATP-binding protein [Anaerolineales bacterium HSG24]
MTLPQNITISVEKVSKIYSLYNTPSDRLKQSLWYALPNMLRRRSTPVFSRQFWALHEASFQIERGETVGIIGRNGSGKSTILQMIAGTLTPSHGQIQVRGKVAALLELGSGFNPEFTGRENVYMNGAILGMSAHEIDAIYDHIVAFADIGPYIDQPVKFYSSGMFVRLAFAVQAFVPKEVLIVDEALSVGDAAFQRKCMVQLEKFRDEGGTVLLVSHDTQTIIRQCARCLLLSYGRLVLDGPSKLVSDTYQKILFSTPEEENLILEQARALIPPTGGKLTSSPSLPKGQEDSSISTNLSEAGFTNSKITRVLSAKSSDSSIIPQARFDPHLPQPEETSYSNGVAEITDCAFYTITEERVNVLVVGERYEWVYRVSFRQDAYDVNFGMMIKTTDGIDLSGVVTDREGIFFKQITAPTIMEARFALTINLIPGNYFLNSGVFGLVDGEATYLHRRVDIAMIQVISRDERQPYGLAYLDPEVKVRRGT